MAFQLGHTSPNKGKTTTTDPIRGDDIQRIKDVIKDRPRDRVLFALATNCALRASDLTRLKWQDLQDDGERITIVIREQKTQKLRRIVLNPSVSQELRVWSELSAFEWVVSGQRGKLTTASVGRLVKSWCDEAGVTPGQYASHSLRKTWCRAQVEQFNEPLYKIMWALGHNSERQSATYIGLLVQEVAGLYEHVV